MVTLPLRGGLLVIAALTALFQWSYSLFISGLIVTLLGLAMLTTLFRDALDRTFSSLALLPSLFGNVFMVIYLAIPLQRCQERLSHVID
jgi:fumarate reductase subunit D